MVSVFYELYRFIFIALDPLAIHPSIYWTYKNLVLGDLWITFFFFGVIGIVLLALVFTWNFFLKKRKVILSFKNGLYAGVFVSGVLMLEGCIKIGSIYFSFETMNIIFYQTWWTSFFHWFVVIISVVLLSREKSSITVTT